MKLIYGTVIRKHSALKSTFRYQSIPSTRGNSISSWIHIFERLGVSQEEFGYFKCPNCSTQTKRADEYLSPRHCSSMFASYATLYRHALVRHDERNFQVRRCDTTTLTSLKLSLLRRYSRDPIIVFFTVNHEVIGQRLLQDDDDDEQSFIDIFRADLAPPVVHSVQNSNNFRNVNAFLAVTKWGSENLDNRISSLDYCQSYYAVISAEDGNTRFSGPSPNYPQVRSFEVFSLGGTVLMQLKREKEVPEASDEFEQYANSLFEMCQSVNDSVFHRILTLHGRLQFVTGDYLAGTEARISFKNNDDPRSETIGIDGNYFHIDQFRSMLAKVVLQRLRPF
ncbi:hypothetical protein BASA50_004338 [Batrachochytrium salamandrivorans]|uniref:C2H2-type domain-containing protein n=1 Tax=Batrachochytrium salamandrivorans TaxID=1357716 RepID=A0ABQ8FG33_9FUNG|nr:hypothetical protein BASA50_004338 [Batrachochytrium salamandrivorans]